MADMSSQLAALCAKIRNLPAQSGGTNATLRVSMACIYIAMQQSLGRVAAPSRLSLGPTSTSQFDNYESLGAGHHGYVNTVRHRTTGKTFARKILKFKFDRIGTDLYTLWEACLMTACRGHPSLVRFYDVCQDNIGRYCLIMEHLGPSLEKVLTRQRHGKPFQEHEVRHMMRQIMSGAKAMHDRGIVHRGIVAENVLVVAARSGRGGNGGHYTVKIGGYGQATCVTETDVPCWWWVWNRPPEMLLRGRGSFESELLDSWSIGCLMVKLLTGMPLFPEVEGEPAQQLHKIFDVLGVPCKRHLRNMKAEDHGLAKEVEERWTARQRHQVGNKLPPSDNWLRKIVPPEILSNDGFNVLQGLLKCNPRKRLKVGDALQHPWFANNDNAPPENNDNDPALSPSRPFSWLRVTVLSLLFLGVFVVCFSMSRQFSKN